MTNQGFTKEFLSQISNLKNSHLLSLTTVFLIHQDEVLPLLKNGVFQTGSYSFNFSDIASLIENSKKLKNNDLEILKWEYLMFSTRGLFISLYEGFKNDNIRYPLVKSSNWFVFIANIRHSLAHGMNAI